MSIDRVLNKEHFMIKSTRKCASKLLPDPFLILVNNPNTHYMQYILLKIRHFERKLSRRSLKSSIIGFNFHSLNYKQSTDLFHCPPIFTIFVLFGPYSFLIISGGRERKHWEQVGSWNFFPFAFLLG